ncbi:MAG: hypothetical protein WBH85_00285 [Thermoanaerobaculia bacterium]
MRVELQTPAKGADRLGHVAAMEVRHTQVIGAQHEVWILLQGFLVALDGLVEGSLVEVHGAEHVVGNNMIGFTLQQPLELTPRFPLFALARGDQGMKDAMIDEGVAEKQAAFGAELVCIGRLMAASRASHRHFSWPVCPG